MITNWSTRFGAVYKITRAWRIRANYAEAFKMPTPDQLFRNEEVDQDLQYTPEWTVSCGLRFVYPEIGLTSHLNVTYTSQQDITDYEGTGETTLASYTVADLTVSKNLISFNKYGSLTLNAAIRNLFDKDYATIQGYPMPGRSYSVGLKYEY